MLHPSCAPRFEPWRLACQQGVGAREGGERGKLPPRPHTKVSGTASPLPQWGGGRPGVSVLKLGRVEQ